MKIKYPFIIIITFLLFSGCVETKKSNTPQKTPKFVLTELNGQELEEEAYLTVNVYSNTFILELGDGTIYKYTLIGRAGSDPFCNILTTDNLGRKTAICVKQLGGMKVMVIIENDEVKSSFIGHAT